MRNAFEAALDEVKRSQAEPLEPLPSLPGIAIDMAAAAPAGHHSLWEAAAEWTPEADPPPPRPAPPPKPPLPRPSARIEDIAIELQVGLLRTPGDLGNARRRFMWDNHPDRRADLDRDLANRRVALANMLLDRALAALRKRGGSG